jgi:hypothetical protein
VSLYGMLFGQNPAADVILGTLGLTKEGVGRFRDAYVADGQIAVYTRNGGGNRECWHAEDPEWGEEGCRHEAYEAIEDEIIEKVGKPEECGCGSHSIILSTPERHDHHTGRKVTVTRYRCLAPASAECACYGCTITYRLPQHPCYIRDEDDDFDSTYATVYFRFPEDYAAGLAALDSGEAWDPDARWQAMIERIGEKA